MGGCPRVPSYSTSQADQSRAAKDLVQQPHGMVFADRLIQRGSEQQDLIASQRGLVPVFHRRHSSTDVSSLSDGHSIPYNSHFGIRPPGLNQQAALQRDGMPP